MYTHIYTHTVCIYTRTYTNIYTHAYLCYSCVDSQYNACVDEVDETEDALRLENVLSLVSHPVEGGVYVHKSRRVAEEHVRPK